MPIRILVVNDQPIVARGLATLLNGEPDMQVVGEAGSCRQCCELIAEQRPDVVICELELPDACTAETLQCLSGRPETPAVVVFSLHDDAPHITQAVQAGVRGYISHLSSVETLLEAVRTVAKGGCYLGPIIAANVMKLVRTPGQNGSLSDLGLNKRQVELLRQVAAGRDNREIAQSLGVSIHTVKYHVHCILKQLHVRTRQEAAALAAEHGLVKLKPFEPRK